jgi:hypothetical protein
MKKFIVGFAAALVCSIQGHAGQFYPNDCCDTSISADIGAGYRNDRLKWAFPGFSPGASVRSKWSGIDIGFIEANGRACLPCGYVIKGDFDYGWSGWARDRHLKLVDYNNDTDDRHNERTRANVYDISIGVGRQFCCDCLCGTYTPLIGWSYNHQKFTGPSFFHRGEHKSSRYAWNGGWVGFEAEYNLNCSWNLFFDYAFHVGDFEAKVDEFFRHRHRDNTFFGNEVQLKTVYQWSECLDLGFKVNYKSYWTRDRESTYEAHEGGGHRRQTTWNSVAISVDLGRTF